MPDILASDYRLTEGSDGYVLDETRIVELDSLPVSQEAALYGVLNDPNIPRRGDPHPAIPGIRVVSRDVETLGNAQQFKVKIKWAIATADDLVTGVTNIRTGSGSHGEQISIDLNGDPIQTVLEVTTTLPDGDTSTRVDEQVHNVDVERPATSVELERVEGDDPSATARFYVGKINAVPWYGGASGTWLCTGIEGHSDDGGATFKVKYQFQYNPEGWNPVIRHRDPQTGLPFFGNAAFNPGAIITPQVYRVASFGALGLL